MLIARSDIGNPELVTEIQKKEVGVKDVAVYRTIEGVKDCIDRKDSCGGEIEEGGERSAGDIACVFFTSASTVRGFASLFSGMDFSQVTALCIGEMTAREAQKQGMRVRIAKRADVESLIELVM